MVLTAKNAALALVLGIGVIGGGCSQTERSVAGGAVAGAAVGGVVGYCTAQRCFD